MTASTDYLLNKTFGTAPIPAALDSVQLGDAAVSTGNFRLAHRGQLPYCSIVLEETTNKVYLVWQRSRLPATDPDGRHSAERDQAVQVPSLAQREHSRPGRPIPADNAYYEFGSGAQPARDLSLGSTGAAQCDLAPAASAIQRHIPQPGQPGHRQLYV